MTTAKARYDEALVLATALGMRPLVAHCHLGLGKLCRRTEDGAKAEEHLTTATAMYREMGMGFWLERAEAELKESQWVFENPAAMAFSRSCMWPRRVRTRHPSPGGQRTTENGLHADYSPTCGPLSPARSA